jgi:hypothetical protein
VQPKVIEWMAVSLEGLVTVIPGFGPAHASIFPRSTLGIERLQRPTSPPHKMITPHFSLYVTLFR